MIIDLSVIMLILSTLQQLDQLNKKSISLMGVN